MSEAELLALAKRGDAPAIAQLIQRSSQFKDITVEASFDKGCLQVFLEALQVPDQQTLVEFIRKGLLNLQAVPIQMVRIYGQQTGEDFPDWTAEFTLKSPISPPAGFPGTPAPETSPKRIETPQPSLQELASVGDPEAIAQLLNHVLAHQHIQTTASLQGGCLHLILESPQVPEQHGVRVLVRRELLRLKIKHLRSVKANCYCIGSALPAWSDELDLTSSTSSALVAVTDSQPISSQPISNQPISRVNPRRTPSPPWLWADLIPYREVVNVDLYNNGTVRLLLFLSLFPLTGRLIFGKAEHLELTAWILGIYYSFIWGVVLDDLIKPPHFSWGHALKCALFTIFIGIPLLLLLQQVPPFNLLYATLKQQDISSVIGFILGVGVLEELCKASPLYLFLFQTHRLNDPLTASFYGAISGLGFAIAEGGEYSLRYAWGLAEGEVGFGSYILINTIRFISLPLFHAIWSAIVGYFMGLAALHPSRQWIIMGTGIGISAVLHGLYDVFSGSILGVIIIAFSILLFVTYLCRSEQMAIAMQQAEKTFKG
ncbi:MAG: PrsW family glutamic-type intramembrane protease [Leptolyngbyaceae bacterium]|nr:PrsW family glutamic-type intramembrane protease [Leptolyngbyaceae bacterium]